MPIWNGIPRKLWQSSPVKHVRRYLPQPLQARLRKATNRYVSRQTIDLAEVTSFLRSIQRPQVDHLSEILNRGFPEWTTLHGHSGMGQGGGFRSAAGR
jgi:hypothetical protein